MYLEQREFRMRVGCRVSTTSRAISARPYLGAAVVLRRPPGRSPCAGIPGRGVGAHAHGGNAPAAGARHRLASPCQLRALEPGGRVCSITGVAGAQRARRGSGADGAGARGDRGGHQLVSSSSRRCRSVERLPVFLSEAIHRSTILLRECGANRRVSRRSNYAGARCRVCIRALPGGCTLTPARPPWDPARGRMCRTTPGTGGLSGVGRRESWHFGDRDISHGGTNTSTAGTTWPRPPGDQHRVCISAAASP